MIAVLISAILTAGCAAKSGARVAAIPVASDSIELLRPDLQLIFDDPNFADAQWGVEVISLDRAEVVYEQNPCRLYMPASNNKIVTAAVALIRLGPEYRYLPQRGRDLGERMKNGFLDTFTRGFEKVVLIGSDIPDLPLSFVEEAFTSLSEMDAVIGPSFDGGYYLIGFTKGAFLPRVFEGIAWGTEKVFKSTIQILTDEKRKLYVLPRWRDIDTIEDLKDLSTPPFNIPGRMKRPAM